MADSPSSSPSDAGLDLGELPVATPLPAPPQSPPSSEPRSVSPWTPQRDAETKASATVPLDVANDVRSSRKSAGKSSTKLTDTAADDLLDDLPTAADLVRDAPAWLASAIIHMVLMIVLGLWIISRPIVDRFVLQLGPEMEGEDLAPGDLDMPFELDQPLFDEATSLDPQAVQVSEAMAEETALPTPVAALGAASAAATEPIQASLSGRQAGMKEGLLKAYGGTAGTQLAVEEALRWLARNNDSKTGLWNLDGPYSDGASPNNRDAATALALIAFQGNGHTPIGNGNDPYTRLTAKAWRAMLARQDKEGNFFQEGSSHGRLYTQAMCTIALCELYGMTKESQYREAAQSALDYCIKVQAPEGGWRYNPGIDSDLSVTGWFVMALQSGRMAGLDVPADALRRVGGFLDLVAFDGGAEYGYVRGQGKKLSMTAEGLLCRQYLGWRHDSGPLNRGVEVLSRNLVDWTPRDNRLRDAYYWYYATQVCHHMEGTPWREWNRAMSTILPEHQIRSGRERGSWDPRGDEWGSRGGGRLLVTCLHTFMLEVYYRHLPIYQLKLLGSAE